MWNFVWWCLESRPWFLNTRTSASLFWFQARQNNCCVFSFWKNLATEKSWKMVIRLYKYYNWTKLKNDVKFETEQSWKMIIELFFFNNLGTRSILSNYGDIQATSWANMEIWIEKHKDIYSLHEKYVSQNIKLILLKKHQRYSRKN